MLIMRFFAYAQNDANSSVVDCYVASQLRLALNVTPSLPTGPADSQSIRQAASHSARLVLLTMTVFFIVIYALAVFSCFG